MYTLRIQSVVLGRRGELYTKCIQYVYILSIRSIVYNPYTICRLGRLYTECIQYVCEQLRVVYDCIQSAPFVAEVVLHTVVPKLHPAYTIVCDPFRSVENGGQVYTYCIHLAPILPPRNMLLLPEPYQFDPSGSLQKKMRGAPQTIRLYTDCIQIVYTWALRHACCIHIVYNRPKRLIVYGLYTICRFLL